MGVFVFSVRVRINGVRARKGQVRARITGRSMLMVRVRIGVRVVTVGRTMIIV